jgi:transcriptional regulator GlxA family with amidase domain
VALLEELGAKYTEQRVVQQGKIVTAAGVSSGIDMALTLAAQIAGEDKAKALQLMIEYDPQPPFDAGSPSKAGPKIIALTGALEEPVAA